MIKCDVPGCRKELKTAQGLAGHKQLKHGIMAPGNQQLEQPERFVTEGMLKQRISDLQGRVLEQQRQLDYQQLRIEQHDKWFNPRNILEVILDMNDGPIADLERKLLELLRLLKGDIKLHDEVRFHDRQVPGSEYSEVLGTWIEVVNKLELSGHRKR